MRIVSFAEVLTTIEARPARVGATRLVIVDGRSGSGKTDLVGRWERLALARGHRAVTVHADDLYEGWSHPTAFADRLRSRVLSPLENGDAARYRPYDWNARRFAQRERVISSPTILFMEGVSTSDMPWLEKATFSLFVTVERRLGFARAVARDGDSIRDALREWQRDEDAHFSAHRPWERVDVIVDGAPSVNHDPNVEFVSVPPQTARADILGS